MELLAAPVLLIAVVLYVAWPLLGEDADAAAAVVRAGELEATRIEKDNLVESLRDLEMDFRMGKLSEEDYRALSAHLESEAVKVLRQLEDLDETEAAAADEARS